METISHSKAPDDQESMDETDYLRSNPVNAQRLLDSIRELEAGQGIVVRDADEFLRGNVTQAPGMQKARTLIIFDVDGTLVDARDMDNASPFATASDCYRRAEIISRTSNTGALYEVPSIITKWS